MVSTQNWGYYFPPTPHSASYPPKVAPSPKFPVPPPHPYPNPPSPAAKPPGHSIPPPSSPPHPIPPPPTPPHIVPTPPPPPHIVPTPPPPGHHSTVIIVVFVSLGGLFFLAFLSVALCCFLKKKKKKTRQETDIIKVDEHLKVHEVIIPGPHGAETVVLSIDEDIHIQEEIKKNETVGKASHIVSAAEHPQALGTVASTSGSGHHHLDHKN
ncbi:hypothetical protein RJ639_016241 [Escallonia herrerae]|uniref:Uncharacterized protein n=1 Tax=Escallonia herrerae TaxID=1293975 RepID=A0AA89AMG8_9ASTE|nr:hypothetical protein RJ639_016241 [Escallonia herrerae]